MGANIRDLRELVCVSRLTVRHSDDEYTSSEEELTQRFERSLSRLHSLTDSSRETFSWDSGISTANHSPQESQPGQPSQEPTSSVVNQAGTKLKDADSYAVPRSYRKKKRKKKSSMTNSSSALLVGHDFPRPPPLPPVGSSLSLNRQSSSCSSDSGRVMTPVQGQTKEGDFDELLSYLDATVVSEWLQNCNLSVADMASWFHAGENFVKFAHFWLTDFPITRKMEIFKLEYGIVVDNIRFAFSVGLDSDKIRWRDVSKFIQAVFREYPEKLLSAGGAHMFLDHLHVLTSERQEEYRTVLSNVKCSTRNRQYAQLVLAVRSFALVSVWYAVTNFYRKIAGNLRTDMLAEAIPIAEVNKKDPHVHRLYHSISNGFLDVVFYLIKTKKVQPSLKDAHNRNLVFVSVMQNQPKILQYFLKHCKPGPDPNEAADTGNSPLHAAANSGNAELTSMLLTHPDINVNITNSLCENATPLHIAVMHGHINVVEELLKTGADLNLTMGGQTALEVARDFEHEEIQELLQNHNVSVQSQGPDTKLTTIM